MQVDISRLTAATGWRGKCKCHAPAHIATCATGSWPCSWMDFMIQIEELAARRPDFDRRVARVPSHAACALASA